MVSSNETSLGDQEDAYKQGRKIDDIDKDADITLVDETQGRYGDETLWKLVKLSMDQHGQKRAMREYYVGRIVRIKRLLNDLRVIAAQLMLLVYKLLLLVLKVNVASTNVTTTKRLRLLKKFLLSEEG
ncbi:hypothetical protein Tco_0037471 [Tanacetum coccineum]